MWCARTKEIKWIKIWQPRRRRMRAGWDSRTSRWALFYLRPITTRFHSSTVPKMTPLVHEILPNSSRLGSRTTVSWTLNLSQRATTLQKEMETSEPWIKSSQIGFSQVLLQNDNLVKASKLSREQSRKILRIDEALASTPDTCSNSNFSELILNCFVIKQNMLHIKIHSH